jgi:hypothetical protein
MKRPFTLIAAIIFALITVVHAYRLITQFQVTAGSHTLPMWVSIVGIAVAGILAFGLYRESRA